MRVRADLTQGDVVAAVKSIAPQASLSQAEMSRIEHGRSIPDVSYLPHLLSALRADSDERESITDKVTAAHRSITPARKILEAGTAHFQARIRDLEDQSELVRSFHPTTVLGVLQTEAFVTAVFQGLDDAQRSVAERLARSRALLDGSDRRWALIQTEGALRWNFAGAEIMADQLDHIAALARASHMKPPRVRVGIIPWNVVTGVQPMHGFHIYDFPDRRYRRDPRMVQVGTHSGTALLGEQDAEQYDALFTQLERVATFGDQAAALAAEIAGDYRALRTAPASGSSRTPL